MFLPKFQTFIISGTGQLRSAAEIPTGLDQGCCPLLEHGSVNLHEWELQLSFTIVIFTRQVSDPQAQIQEVGSQRWEAGLPGDTSPFLPRRAPEGHRREEVLEAVSP